MATLWVVAPYNLVVYQRLALMMEAASTSETFVNYQTTRRYNPEDSHLHSRRRENLKSTWHDFYRRNNEGKEETKKSEKVRE
jgi:hypothetical protein